ncbi:hypothetical protein RvY_00861 [Ramazzottius varieornatus]|uniref:carbonyl reductase (NADPH) n=1 Tax=Ramazzottius varieornatus TaxID=947166 RepID=A0A1D1UI99_RAMVA|nr:hypothetical protein RvY_00861 [Ramazzottius varieornatus]
MASPAAVVTGANKGIGLQIVKELCKKFSGTVYLTARSAQRGKAAAESLQKDGLEVEYLNLDVTNVETIKQAAKYLRSEHGGLDILCNNAGVLFYSKTKEDFPKEAEETIATNFFGVLNVCEYLFPLLRPHARVVNITSGVGHLKYIKDDTIKQKLKSDTLTVDELRDIMQQYLKAVRQGDYEEKGFTGYPDMYGAYPMSKIGVTALTRIQQRMFDQERPGDDIIVNAVCPGYVATDMTQHKGVLTVMQGADTPVYAATLPPVSGDAAPSELPRGQFIINRKVRKFPGS